MVVFRPLLAATALLASLASASPLQANHRLEERVPFCEGRNPVVVSLRNAPKAKATAFCSSFLGITPLSTSTKTIVRTVCTLTTRPVSVLTTRTTGTVTSRPADATFFSDQVSVVVTTPKSTQASIITEPSLELSVATILETSTISEASTVFETSVNVETSVLTETSSTSTTSFISTTTRTTLPGDVARRAQATPAAQIDRRLISPNVIRTARETVSSACSCIVKRPTQRTRTTTRYVTSTSIRPPTSTRTIRTTLTTIVPQASVTVPRLTTTTSEAPTDVSVTLTTVTSPTTSETSTTSTSPLTVTTPTTERTQTTSTTQTTTTTSTTSVIEATQTVSVAYVDRCAVRGSAPDATTRFVTATGVTESACGTECSRDAGCKSWVYQETGRYCQLFTANLLRISFIADAAGAAKGYDRSCAVPPFAGRSVPSCGARGYGPNIPAPLVAPFTAARQACADACYRLAGCRSYSIDSTANTCKLYDQNILQYLTEDGFRSEFYYDKVCTANPDTCGVQAYSKLEGEVRPELASPRLCAQACQSSATCESYGIETDPIGSRLCRLYTAKVSEHRIASQAPPNYAFQRLSDKGCVVPETESVACGTAGFAPNQADASFSQSTLQQCSVRCNERQTCLTFIYLPQIRRCNLFDLPAGDAAHILNPDAISIAEQFIYNRGCSTPAVQTCNAFSRTPDPEPPSLDILTNLSGFSACVAACQSNADCLSSSYRTSPNTCTLYSTIAADNGFLATDSDMSLRYHDKSCGLLANSNCQIRSNSLPSNANILQATRDLTGGRDSIALCDDLCRRSQQCKSYSFSTSGGTTSCKIYGAAFEDLSGLDLSATGSILLTDAQQCGTLADDAASLQRLCGPPAGTRLNIGRLFGSGSYPYSNAAAALEVCRNRCAQTDRCQSYAGKDYGSGYYLCSLYAMQAIFGLATGGPRGAGGQYPNDVYPGFYDLSCPGPI